MPLTTTNANDLNLSRRGFLRASSTAAGGLLLALFLDPPAAAQERSEAPSQPKAYPPAAFVEIRADGKIVIQVNRLEFGQGVQTALPMILADEMDADWSQVVAELAPAAASENRRAAKRANGMTKPHRRRQRCRLRQDLCSGRRR